MALRRIGSIAFLGLGLSVYVLAQGGQGGGFGGGGAGGGSIPTTGTEVVRTHILTPGDKGEWVVDAEDNETIIASASSTVFDPAIEVVDEKGTVLASNDDIEPGVQSARVLYRFPKAGKYRVWVKGYKSAAGGQYEIRLRRFIPALIEFGKRQNTSVDETGIGWFRIPVKKGETLVINAASTTFAPRMDLFAPDGAQVEDNYSKRRRMQYLLKPTKDGEYYASIASGRSSKAGLSIYATPARKFSTTIGAVSDQQKLEASGVDIWRFEGKPGDLILVQAQSTGPDVQADFNEASSDSNSETDAKPPYVFVRSTEKLGGSFVVLVLRKMAFEITVSQNSDLPTSYKMSLTKPEKELSATGLANSEIGVGRCDYWLMEGKSGQVLHFDASATTFDSTIMVIDPKGNRIGFNDDGDKGSDAALTVSLPEAGRYIVMVSSQGGGGSGKYSLKRTEIKAKPLQLGGSVQGAIQSSEVEIWNFSGKENQSILISAQAPMAALRITIFGPDGLVLAESSSDEAGVNGLASLKLPSDGNYTVWIRSSVGGGAYKLKCIDLDS